MEEILMRLASVRSDRCRIEPERGRGFPDGRFMSIKNTSPPRLVVRLTALAPEPR